MDVRAFRTSLRSELFAWKEVARVPCCPDGYGCDADQPSGRDLEECQVLRDEWPLEVEEESMYFDSVGRETSDIDFWFGRRWRTARHSSSLLSQVSFSRGEQEKGGERWNSHSYHWVSSHQICFDNAFLVLHLLMRSVIFIDTGSGVMINDQISSTVIPTDPATMDLTGSYTKEKEVSE